MHCQICTKPCLLGSDLVHNWQYSSAHRTHGTIPKDTTYAHALAHTTQNETTYVHRPKQLYFTSNVDIGEVIYKNATIANSTSLQCITKFKSIETNKSTGEHASQSYRHVSGIDQIVSRTPTKYTVTYAHVHVLQMYLASCPVYIWASSKLNAMRTKSQMYVKSIIVSNKNTYNVLSKLV